MKIDKKVKTRRKNSNKKIGGDLYLLIKSNKEYNEKDKQITGKVIEVAVINKSQPCLLVEDKNIIIKGGKIIKRMNGCGAQLDACGYVHCGDEIKENSIPQGRYFQCKKCRKSTK